MKLFITEFSKLAVAHQNHVAQAPMIPPTAEQALEIGIESKQSEFFHGSARMIMVHAEAACCLAFGKDPIAKPEFHRLGPGETRFYGTEGDETKLAVIAS